MKELLYQAMAADLLLLELEDQILNTEVDFSKKN